MQRSVRNVVPVAPRTWPATVRPAVRFPGDAVTATSRDRVLGPPSFETVRRTVYDPSAEKVWIGRAASDVFCAPDAGSPKSQVREETVPAERSVKDTASPATGPRGPNEKAAAGGFAVDSAGLGTTTKTWKSGPVGGGAGRPTGAAGARPFIGSWRLEEPS